MNETAERLMDLAEARIREAGYRGFSFRDLAAEIGIKSASVHHHFPTKAGMAAAVARRYGDRFFEVVARRHDESGDDVIAIYRSAFRSAIERDGRMCLNGVLGAEAGGLPPEVVAEIEMFFRRCIDDLSSRIGGCCGSGVPCDGGVGRRPDSCACLWRHPCVRSGDGGAYRAQVRSRLMTARKRAVMIPASG
jgi:TetR/AcrR family transcriptional repressor of nem operon